MKAGILIADSGGSGTSWCYVSPEGIENYFETESYHPANYSEAFFVKMSHFWLNKTEYKEAKLFFYGAGMGSDQHKQTLQQHFEQIGIRPISIENDAVACCAAYFGQQAGILSVMGTGSVVMHYDGEKIVKQEGGLGYLLGDEGSGFYFAKLFLNHWLTGNISLELAAELEKKCCARQEVMSLVYSEQGRAWMASLAKRLVEFEALFPEIGLIHHQNVQYFFTKHSGLLEADKSIPRVFIGSYAYHRKGLILDELEPAIEARIWIEAKPIKQLVTWVLNTHQVKN